MYFVIEITQIHVAVLCFTQRPGKSRVVNASRSQGIRINRVPVYKIFGLTKVIIILLHMLDIFNNKLKYVINRRDLTNS